MDREMPLVDMSTIINESERSTQIAHQLIAEIESGATLAHITSESLSLEQVLDFIELNPGTTNVSEIQANVALCWSSLKPHLQKYRFDTDDIS
jgi:hypothetical protein